MRIIIGDISAAYEGRGSTTLSRGIRMVMVKEDGSVSIHNENSNKPLNYMKTANFTEFRSEVGEAVWVFEARNEFLRITVHEKHHEVGFDMMLDDPGLVRDGTENHLQGWIAENVEQVLGQGFSLVKREFNTGHGPVDLLVLDPDGVPVCVEVKRTGLLGVVYQTKRYVEAVREIEESEYDFEFDKAYGIIAALDIRPKTLIFAEKHNLKCVTVDKSWNKSISDD